MFLQNWCDTFVKGVDLKGYQIRASANGTFMELGIVNRTSINLTDYFTVELMFPCMGDSLALSAQWYVRSHFDNEKILNTGVVELKYVFGMRDDLKHFVKLLNEAEIPYKALFDGSMYKCLGNSCKKINRRLVPVRPVK